MKHVLMVMLAFVVVCKLVGQSEIENSSFTETLYTMTTVVYVVDQKGKVDQATGFFFSDIDSLSGKVGRTWLISNRHVLFPNHKIPRKIILNLRQEVDHIVNWVPITIDDSYLNTNLSVFPDTTIDVAAIEISKILSDAYHDNNLLATTQSLSLRNFVENTKYKPEVGDDILSVGYPLNYYDKHNKFPIVKTGIIASAFGLNFNGGNCFAIDCKLFPGSSGSLVIAKPKDVRVVDGKLQYRKEKAFVLLGIYAGEFYTNKVSTNGVVMETNTYDLGAVFYAELIKALLGIK